MKVVALVSGGKDSCYAMMKCIQYGHEIVALANLMPSDDTVDELDSYMYQTVGHHIVIFYAKCMGLPLFRRRIQGSTRYQKLSYKMTPGDEVEDMFILLSEVKKQIPSINAVSSGAIASDYQRLRVECVCSRLGLVSLAYLWKRDQLLLLEEMVDNGIIAILVKVASMGMDPKKHLGKDIAQLKPYLRHLKDMYGINICGEGGEYETLTLDCPLFTNARIVLDEFKVVLHSLDSIASVGILHPVSFHLDIRNSVSCDDKINYNITDGNHFAEKAEFVHEVQQNIQQEIFTKCTYVDKVDDLLEFSNFTFFTWRTNWSNTFSMGFCLQNFCSSGFQEELIVLLSKVESQLEEYGFGWEYVLYIHLYISDMDNFALANETYLRFITEDKCRFGVPSRCTVEMPLIQAGFARTYVELLVTNCECRKALHVQSISCWAPSCIGPYSQATLHDNVLHMAGQLGLDPPTMTLRLHGPVAELEQAIINCEAVAKCFNSSIATETIMFSFYLSADITSSQKKEIEEKLELLLQQMRTFELNGSTGPDIANPIFLYIVVPGLPKRASVEVKPLLYVEEAPPMDMPTELTNEVGRAFLHAMPGFQQEPWHNSLAQKCVIYGKICAAVLNITHETASKILSEMFSANQNHADSQYLACKQMEGLARFCFTLLDMILRESGLTWEDLMVLRIYVPTSWCLSPGTIASVFSKGCELVTGEVKKKGEYIFSLVPVLGCGRSATSMNDIITCELFAAAASGRWRWN